jgi:hypothetical protein
VPCAYCGGTGESPKGICVDGVLEPLPCSACWDARGAALVEAWRARAEAAEAELARLEEMREPLDLPSVAPTDNAPPRGVLAGVYECAIAWEPGARIIGNVRAGDIARAVTHAVDAMDRAEAAERVVSAVEALAVKWLGFAETHRACERTGEGAVEYHEACADTLVHVVGDVRRALAALEVKRDG